MMIPEIRGAFVFWRIPALHWHNRCKWTWNWAFGCQILLFHLGPVMKGVPIGAAGLERRIILPLTTSLDGEMPAAGGRDPTVCFLKTLRAAHRWKSDDPSSSPTFNLSCTPPDFTTTLKIVGRIHPYNAFHSGWCLCRLFAGLLSLLFVFPLFLPYSSNFSTAAAFSSFPYSGRTMTIFILYMLMVSIGREELYFSAFDLCIV